MRLLICSDIHGNAFYTKKLEELIEKKPVDKIVLLGDVYYYGPRLGFDNRYNPKIVKEILNKYAYKMIAVRGNCDAEIDDEVSDFDLSKDYDYLDIDNRRYYFTHGHLMDKYSDLFGNDIVFSGHTHVYNLEGNNINPGSVGLPKVNPEHTCIIFEDNTINLIDLDNFKTIDSRKIETD